MGFKDEFQEIHIPEQLTKRVKIGIQQAHFQKKRKTKWTTTIATVIVTAAMLYFIIAPKSFFATQSVHASGHSSIIHPAVIIGSIVSLCSCGLTFIFIRKKQIKLRFIILSLITALSITWNLVEMESQKLIAPYIFTPSPYNSHENMLRFDYIDNGNESRTVQQISINGSIYNVNLYNTYEVTTYTHHQLKTVEVPLDERTFEDIFSNGAVQVNALFSDGTEVVVPTDSIQSYYETKASVWNVSGSEGTEIHQSFVIIADELSFDTLLVPETYVNRIHMTIRLVEETAYNNSYISDDYSKAPILFDGIPKDTELKIGVQLKKKDFLRVTFESKEDKNYHYLANEHLVIAGDGQKIPLVTFQMQGPRYAIENIKAIVNSQRGDLLND